MAEFQINLKKIEFAFQIANQSLFVSPIPALDKRLSRHGLEMQVKQFVARSLMYMALLLTSRTNFKPFGLKVNSVAFENGNINLYFGLNKMSQETTMRDVDWFAVGIIMLKMFTGKVPYMKNSLTVEKHPIIPYYLKSTTKSFLHVLFTKKFHTKLSGGGFQFHPYFAGVNWVAIRKAVEKDATVPWISIKHPMLLNDVIKEFVEAKRVDKTRKIFSFEFLRALLIAAGIVFVPILIGNTAGTLIRLTLCALYAFSVDRILKEVTVVRYNIKDMAPPKSKSKFWRHPIE